MVSSSCSRGDRWARGETWHVARRTRRQGRMPCREFLQFVFVGHGIVLVQWCSCSCMLDCCWLTLLTVFERQWLRGPRKGKRKKKRRKQQRRLRDLLAEQGLGLDHPHQNWGMEQRPDPSRLVLHNYSCTLHIAARSSQQIFPNRSTSHEAKTGIWGTSGFRRTQKLCGQPTAVIFDHQT